MKLKIGVMGSATGVLFKKHKELAYELGRAIADEGCITITGACPGLPLDSARGAFEEAGLVVGISAALSEREHVNKYHSPLECHDVMIYTGSGLMGERSSISGAQTSSSSSAATPARSASSPSLMTRES